MDDGPLDSADGYRAVGSSLRHQNHRGPVKYMLFALLPEFHGNLGAQVMHVRVVGAGKDQTFIIGMHQRSLRGMAYRGASKNP